MDRSRLQSHDWKAARRRRNWTAPRSKPLNVPAGSAFIFEQRTFHSIGHNWSGFPKTLFVGYAYRWVKPMDYVQMPEELIARANPVQRRLLGDVSDALSYYIRRDE